MQTWQSKIAEIKTKIDKNVTHGEAEMTKTGSKSSGIRRKNWELVESCKSKFAGLLSVLQRVIFAD